MITINRNFLIADATNVYGLVRRQHVKMKDVMEFSWEQFKAVYELQMLDNKPNFTMRYVKKVKQLLGAFDIKLNECTYYYKLDELLVIDTPLDFYAVIAPRINE